jgi:Fe-S-cluster containining protein
MEMSLKKIKDCSCEKCIDCCNNSCGWFGSIEEVKGASKIMKMKLVDFAKEYLIEEWWVGKGGNDISVIAPRKDFERSKNNFIFEDDKIRNGKGFMRATWGHNLITRVPCIFLDVNNKCKIHESKPQECRECFACKKSDKFKGRDKIAQYWRKHQTFILNLKRKIEKNENDNL